MKIGIDGKVNVFPISFNTPSRYYSLDHFSSNELILLNRHNGYHAWIFNTEEHTFEKQILPDKIASTYDSNDYLGAGLFVLEHVDPNEYLISFSLIGRSDNEWKVIQTFTVPEAPSGRKNVFSDIELISNDPIRIAITTLTYEIVNSKAPQSTTLNPFYAWSEVYERRGQDILEKTIQSIAIEPPSKSNRFKLWSSIQPNVFLIHDGDYAFHIYDSNSQNKVPLTSFEVGKSYNWRVNGQYLITNTIDYGTTVNETMTIKAFDFIGGGEIIFRNAITHNPFNFDWVGFYSLEPNQVEVIFRNTEVNTQLKTYTFQFDTQNMIESEIETPFLFRDLSNMITHEGDVYGLTY